MQINCSGSSIQETTVVAQDFLQFFHRDLPQTFLQLQRQSCCCSRRLPGDHTPRNNADRRLHGTVGGYTAAGNQQIAGVFRQQRTVRYTVIFAGTVIAVA